MKKLLRINKTVVFFITAAVLYGCGSDPDKEDFAARVNKSYLTKSEIDSLSRVSPKHKSEIIRNWVNRELLYNEALDEGIIDSDEFKELIENSKKELAAALMLKKITEKKEIKLDIKAVQEYYESHSEEFSVDEDSFILNILAAESDEKAVKYRNIMMENNWHRLVAVASPEKGIQIEQKVFRSKSDIHPASLMRVVNELNPGEVSIVVNDGNNNYYVIQLISKFPKGTIPPLEFIRTEVEKRYTLEMKNNYIREYLDELYSNNDIEIRTGKK